MKVQRRRLPGWVVSEGSFGIRFFDVGIVALVIVAIEINVINGGGADAVPLNDTAYLVGALLAVPILFRHRWPFRVLIASAVLMLAYYIFARRNISPAPLLFVPLYDAAVVGYLAVAIAIPAFFMAIGLFVVELSTRQGIAGLLAEFLSQIVSLALAVMLGEVVRSRRALTAETARRLRLADTERAAEAGRVVAEERLRIARDLHDTVAHSMATITVQAGSALHLLGPDPAIGPNGPALEPPAPGSGRGVDAGTLRGALTAIRETSKGALTEMRSVLGQLRHSDASGPGGAGTGGAELGAGPARKGLADIGGLCDAVAAAGAPVRVNVEGEQVPLSAEADHAAYRILQESLTNVLRHAGPGAAATVCLRYQPGALVIRVTDDGGATAEARGDAGTAASGARGYGNGDGGHGDSGNGDGGHGDGGRGDGGHGDGGHGIGGMGERAAAVGGELTAGPLPGGGFQVQATLPTLEAAHGMRSAENEPARPVPVRPVAGRPVAARPVAARPGSRAESS